MVLRAIIAALTLLTLAAGAQAAAVSISPVGLDLATPVGAGSISLTNRATVPINLQIRVFQWRNVDGSAALERTEAVIASPPATTIGPGMTNTIRVMRVSGSPPPSEESFRLLIDELPTPVDPRMPPVGIRTVMRMSVPIFFSPPASAANVQWSAWVEGSAVHVRLVNHGGRHLRVDNLRLVENGVVIAASRGLNGYVLARDRLDLMLPLMGAPRPGPAIIEAHTSAGVLQQAVSLDTRPPNAGAR